MRLANFILLEMESILGEWEAYAAQLLPAAASMSRCALRDHAKQMLETIANDIARPQSEAARWQKSQGGTPALPNSAATAAETHAVLRLRSGFDINQLVGEYRALRASVLQLWAAAVPPCGTSLQDTIRFNEAIDQGIAESIAAFSAGPEHAPRLLTSIMDLQVAVGTLEAEVKKRLSAEDHLVDLQQSLAVTLAGIGAGFMATDREGRVTRMNAVAERITGWTQGEAQGLCIWRVFHREGRPADDLTSNPLDLILREGWTADTAHHVTAISRNGQRTAVELRAALTHGDDSQVRGLAIVLRDLTESMRAEAESRRLAAIVESSSDAIVGKTLDGRITNWNGAAQALFGYSAAEAIGQSVRMLIPPEREADEMMILAQLSRGEKVAAFDTLRRAKDGQLRQVSISVSPIRDAQGQIVGAAKIARDVSFQRRAEAALRDADRRKDHFIATLAHELRNPLAPMRFAAQALRRAGGDEAQTARLYEIIERQVGQMVRLLDDLLDASRVSAGKLTLRSERLALAAVLEHAIEIARPSIDAAGHALRVELPPQPVWIDGDSARLMQVYSNLLINAAKYTPREGVITLTAESTEAEVVVRVADTGMGIDPQHQPQVFELFNQVESTLAHAQGGMGIGLALVKGLVEMHGGRVGVTSAGLGKGSEFSVRLPRIAEDAHSAAMHAAADQAGAPDTADGMLARDSCTPR